MARCVFYIMGGAVYGVQIAISPVVGIEKPCFQLSKKEGNSHVSLLAHVMQNSIRGAVICSLEVAAYANG